MAGMRRHFVLRIDHVHFLVGVVHEHVLGAMLLDALGRALASLVVCAFYSTLAVGDPAGPGIVPRHRERSREQRRCHCHRESYFHTFPLQRNPLPFLDTPGCPVAWHRGVPVSRLCPTTSYYLLLPPTLNSYSRMNVNKKGGDSFESSPVLCAPRSRCSAPAELAYCPDVAVLAEVAPPAFGTLR